MSGRGKQGKLRKSLHKMGDCKNTDKAKNQQQWSCSEEYRERENKMKFNGITTK